MKNSPSFPPVKPMRGSLNLEKRLQDLRIQVEETKVRQDSLESQKTNVLSPLQRQQIDIQWRQCQNELKLQTQQLQHVLSQFRHQQLREMNKELKTWVQRLQGIEKQSLVADQRKIQLLAIRDNVVSQSPVLYQLYEYTQDHLDLSTYFYLQWSQLNTLRFNQRRNYFEAEEEPEQLLKNIRQERNPKISMPEKQALEELHKLLSQLCRAYFALAEGILPIRTGTTGELPPANQPQAPMPSPAIPKPIASIFPATGKLQVQFDLERKQSVLTNALGLPLTGEKRSYQEYLNQGYQGIHHSYALSVSGADERAQQIPLMEALDCYLEALSLDESRHEAYFGIGFLYSMVKYFDQAFYFLDLAYHLSEQKPLIREFIEQVKAESRKDAKLGGKK